MKVFLLCSGLGNVKRGYESFSYECFQSLMNKPGIEITLFKGGGKPNHKEIVLWNLPRDGFIAKLLSKIINKSPYFIEQITFTITFLYYLICGNPDIVYFSDGNIGNMLWHFRRKSRMGYRLLFSNGGPLSPPFPRWDFVQQVAPTHAEAALEAGHPSDRQMIAPYGFTFAEPTSPTRSGIAAKRRRLNLPSDRAVVLSVGALNACHKRMDYVINEVARLPEPRPFLLLLGQADAETPALETRALKHLGQGAFSFRTVPQTEVSDYLAVADIFILASLTEGFPRVVGEAFGAGLPCVVHDYPLMRYILGEHGRYIDATQSGALAVTLSALLAHPPSEDERARMRTMARDRFGWTALIPHYLKMLQRCMQTR
jgi:glycosyltransferase involved in cell wall biosynthesis